MTHEHGSALDADRELAIARKWLAELDLPHAAVHVAQAIAADPTLIEAYAELDAMPTLDLFPVDNDAPYIGNMAARAHVSARLGKWGSAFSLICGCIRTEPAKAWTSAPWWPQRGTIPPVTLVAALVGATPWFKTLPDATSRRPFLDMARDLVDAAPGDIELAVKLSIVAEALDAAAVGVSWRTHAAELTPGPVGKILLGYALRDVDRIDEAVATWTAAAADDPGNADIRVILAKTLIEHDRPADGRRWLSAAVLIEPDHLGARMLCQVLDYHKTGAIDPVVAIVDEAVGSGQRQLVLDALTFGCLKRPWVHYIPMPTETIVAMMNQIVDMRAAGKEATATRVAAFAIEPPSAVAAAVAFLPGLRVQVMGCPSPDLRVPLRAVTHRVWSYDGATTPKPANERPSEAAIGLLREIGDLSWPNPVEAYERSAALGSLTVADLLGLLSHMPPHPDNTRWNKTIPNPAYWPRLAAGWACLGILHQRPEEPWLSSTRRQVLVDLAFGVEDWVSDSAVFALVVAAWVDPAVRADVHDLVIDRLAAVRATQLRRLSTIEHSLAELVMLTPGVTARESRQARNVIARSEKPVGGRLGYVLRQLAIRLGR